jgi:hypothetical protein
VSEWVSEWVSQSVRRNLVFRAEPKAYFRSSPYRLQTTNILTLHVYQKLQSCIVILFFPLKNI